MQHGNEITLAIPPSVRALTRFDAIGTSRRAREHQEGRRKPLGVFRTDVKAKRRGTYVNLGTGYGTEIACRGGFSIIRMPNGSVVMLHAGQYSVGA